MSNFILAKNNEMMSEISSLNALARLQVYRNNYFGNLIDALKITYPMFLKLVGEEFFEFCAKNYIRSNPPDSGSLIEYGHNLHEFIATFPQSAIYPYFSELIKFERLLDISHNAKEKGEYLKPTVQMMQSTYDIGEVFEFCKAGDTIKSLQIEEGNYFFLIYREDYIVKYRKISQNFYEFLKNLPDSKGDKGMLQEAYNLGLFS
jgi:hypothetical protein